MKSPSQILALRYKILAYFILKIWYIMIKAHFAMFNVQFTSMKRKLYTWSCLSPPKSENKSQSEFVTTFLFLLHIIYAFVIVLYNHFYINVAGFVSFHKFIWTQLASEHSYPLSGWKVSGLGWNVPRVNSIDEKWNFGILYFLSSFV